MGAPGGGEENRESRVSTVFGDTRKKLESCSFKKLKGEGEGGTSAMGAGEETKRRLRR